MRGSMREQVVSSSGSKGSQYPGQVRVWKLVGGVKYLNFVSARASGHQTEVWQ